MLKLTAFLSERVRARLSLRAYETYLNVLDKDPGNLDASRGLQRIAQKYEVLAKDWMKKERYENVRRMVERGLDVVPNYEPLLALGVKAKEEVKMGCKMYKLFNFHS